MRASLLLAAALLLPACNRERDDGIEPVPAQTAESASRLMNEAERAAASAAVMSNTSATSNFSTENQQ